MSRKATQKWRVPPGFEAAFAQLQTIPNVGPATAEDLVRLGIRSVGGLKQQNPLALYERICRLDGVRHDPCVIDVFMSAVAFARTGSRRTWWSYTPERKRLLARISRAKPRR